MKILVSIDDGHKDDVKMAKLLNKYGLQGIFFIPNCTDLTDNEIKQIAKNHIIGGHTETHPSDLKLLDDDRVFSELFGNKMWLYYLVDQPIYWFAYPRGRFDERIKEIVKKVGFKWARTTKLTLEGEDVDDNLAINGSAHVFDRAEYEGLPWQKVARISFLKAKSQNKTFHLWLHTKEINQYNWWKELEELFKWINQNK